MVVAGVCDPGLMVSHRESTQFSGVTDAPADEVHSFPRSQGKHGVTDPGYSGLSIESHAAVAPGASLEHCAAYFFPMQYRFFALRMKSCPWLATMEARTGLSSIGIVARILNSLSAPAITHVPFSPIM